MRILGIDPGSFNCGYGIIDSNIKSAKINSKPILNAISINTTLSFNYICSGRIVVSPKKPLYERLNELYIYLSDIIEEYKPDEIVIEKIFFAKGIKSALSLGHTRGAILLAAASKGFSIYEYSPLEVKKAVTGYGRADKNQIQSMVRRILGISNPLSPDGADALAIAICHVNSLKNMSCLIKPKTKINEMGIKS